MIAEQVVAAFTQAGANQQEILERWIKASYRLGGLLPTSNLSGSVQSIGHIDTLVRAMEDEFPLDDKVKLAELSTALASNYQRIFSEFWIGSAYEITRLLRERNLAPNTNEFEALRHNLELLRVPLEKHEIAADRKLIDPLIMRKVPVNPDDVDFIYDKNDSQRAHIMSVGVSDRGAYMWFVLDVRAQTEFWLDRRSLSDSFLEIFASDGLHR